MLILIVMKHRTYFMFVDQLQSINIAVIYIYINWKYLFTIKLSNLFE